MVLILTFGLILLVLASAGKLHADDHSKTLMQYMTGLKLLKDQSQNGIAAHGEHKGALFHLGVSYEKGQGVEKDLRLAAHFYRLHPNLVRLALQNRFVYSVYVIRLPISPNITPFGSNAFS